MRPAVMTTMSSSTDRFGALLALVLAAAVAVGLLVLVGTKPAQAAFPGENGKIAFTSTSVTDRSPAFSADGTKIAFDTSKDGNFEIYKMDPNGALQTNLTNNLAATSIRPGLRT